MEPLNEAEGLAKRAWERAASLTHCLDQLRKKLESCSVRASDLRRCRSSAGDDLATRLRSAELEVELANLAIAKRSAGREYDLTVSAYADMLGAIDIAPVLQCCPE